MECGGYRFEAGLPQLPHDAADGKIDAKIERNIWIRFDYILNKIPQVKLNTDKPLALGSFLGMYTLQPL